MGTGNVAKPAPPGAGVFAFVVPRLPEPPIPRLKSTPSPTLWPYGDLLVFGQRFFMFILGGWNGFD